MLFGTSCSIIDSKGHSTLNFPRYSRMMLSGHFIQIIFPLFFKNLFVSGWILTFTITQRVKKSAGFGMRHNTYSYLLGYKNSPLSRKKTVTWESRRGCSNFFAFAHL